MTDQPRMTQSRFVLEKPARAISPVTCRGQLSFFTVQADVLQRLDIPGYLEGGQPL